MDIVGRNIEVRQLGVGPFRVSDVLFPGGLRLARHYHARASLSVILEGHFTQTFSGRTCECPPGAMLGKPPEEAHEDVWPGGRSRHLIIEVDHEATLDGRAHGAAYAAALDEIRHEIDPGVRPLAGELVREIADPDDATPLAAEGLVLQLLARMRRAPEAGPHGPPPHWLRRVEELIRERLAAPVRIGELADEAGVDPSHFSRVFRQFYGTTPGRYLRGIRVAEARRLITETDRPLAEIALRAGFADQSHMTRVFRQHSGTTPARFRRSSGR
jgi:AraC-like DNA-binding protein